MNGKPSSEVVSTVGELWIAMIEIQAKINRLSSEIADKSTELATATKIYTKTSRELLIELYQQSQSKER